MELFLMEHKDGLGGRGLPFGRLSIMPHGSFNCLGCFRIYAFRVRFIVYKSSSL